MAAFHFTLEKVLSFELTKKLDIEKELAAVQQKINEIQAAIEELFCTLRQTNETLKQVYEAGTNTGNILIYKAYLSTLSEKIVFQKREKEKQEYFKKEILLRLKNQNIEVKKLEKFKESQQKVFYRQQEKQQEKSLDEFLAGRLKTQEPEIQRKGV